MLPLLLSPVALLPAAAQTGVQVSTPYPAVVVEAGHSVTFDLDITAPTRQRVDLTVSRLPDGWTATLRGGGFTVDGVFASPDPEEAPDVQLEVTVPPDVGEGAHEVAVTAAGPSGSNTLVVRLRIAEVVAGGVSMTADFPTLAGPADTQFTFDLDLRNDTPEEVTFNLTAEGPPGWQVTARPSAEERAVTATVAGGASERVRVTADPPEAVEAGTYPLHVRAAGGGHSVAVDLVAEVTGTVSLELTTPDERLNLEAVAGRATELSLVVRNTGSGPLTGVSLSASPPSDWDVTFQPEALDVVPPGESVPVTAVVTPAREAVAGDYVVTLTASVPESRSSIDVRTTVQTSRAWGLLGLGLILAAIGGLTGVFRRFGRR